jgi:tight adherence protein B
LKFDQFESLLNAGVETKTAIALLELEAEDQFELIQFAISCGAGLVETAQLLAELEQIEEQTRAEVTQAQQIPQSTRQLMLWLPWLGLGLAELSGLGALKAILSPAGVLFLLAAAALSYLGSWLTRRMTDSAMRAMVRPKQPLLRLAVALEAGLPLSDAVSLAGLKNDESVISFAKTTGVSLRELVRVQLRTDLLSWRTNCLSAAKELSVKLMVPLGLTTLPAFLLLTVAPVLLGALSKGET